MTKKRKLTVLIDNEMGELLNTLAAEARPTLTPAELGGKMVQNGIVELTHLLLDRADTDEQTDARSTIIELVKVQLPIEGAQMALLYNQDRSFTTQMKVEHVKDWFEEGENKIFAYVEINLDEEALSFLDLASWQGW